MLMSTTVLVRICWRDEEEWFICPLGRVRTGMRILEGVSAEYAERCTRAKMHEERLGKAMIVFLK